MAICNLGDRHHRSTTNREKRCQVCSSRGRLLRQVGQGRAHGNHHLQKDAEVCLEVIIYRYGIPQKLVSDNGKQFDSDEFKNFCNELGIVKSFSAVVHPQSNGQVEAVNKTLKHNLKAKLENHKGAWLKELPHVLWAYRTTARTSTGETLFSMAYGVEAMVPVEVRMSFHSQISYTQ